MAKSFIFILILSELIQASVAEKFCFKNKEEYESVKKWLPPIMQKFPLYFGFNGKIVNAVGNVRFDSGKIQFYFNCNKKLKKAIEEAVSICVTGNTINLTFENGATERVQIVDENQINVQGELNLPKVDLHLFSLLAKKISHPGNLDDVLKAAASEGGTK